ncbi:MAG TPA: zinc-ribbon domain-containing protein, partial [Tepidisphaeraceae bacterium]
MDLIRCPRCAKEIPDVSRFCRRCGCSIAWGMAGVVPPPVIPGLPGRGAFSSDRPAATPSNRCGPRRTKSWPQCTTRKSGGGGSGAVLTMLGIAAVTFFMHLQRTTTHPVLTPPAFPNSVRYHPPRPLESPMTYPMPMRSDSSDLVFPTIPMPQAPQVP